jgi:hypothetical protein
MSVGPDNRLEQSQIGLACAAFHLICQSYVNKVFVDYAAFNLSAFVASHSFSPLTSPCTALSAAR